jgi:hypothetical protein
MFDICICTRAIKMHFGWIVDQDQTPKEEEKIIWGGECQDLSLQVALVDLEFRASAKFTNLPLQIPL